MYENRVLRKIFGPKAKEVAGGRRRLHNEKLHDSFTSPNIIRVIKSQRMRLVGHVARMGNMKNAYKIVGKPEGKKLPRRP
jgi:hypothetical protein